MTPAGSKIFVLIMEVLGEFLLYIDKVIEYCIVILCSMSIEMAI